MSKIVKSRLNTEILKGVVSDATQDKILVRDIVATMKGSGFGLVLMLFSLPVIIPLPPPLSSLIAMPLVLFSFQMMLGFSSPKFPRSISNKAIKRKVLAALIEKSSPYLNKVEKLLRPRLTFLVEGYFDKVIGFFALIFSLAILLPLPLSNFIPGLGILITSFGLIGKDGLVVLLGLLLGSGGIAITSVLVIMGFEILYVIKGFFINLF